MTLESAIIVIDASNAIRTGAEAQSDRSKLQGADLYQNVPKQLESQLALSDLLLLILILWRIAPTSPHA
jgi:hypothetical protein